MVEQTSKTKNTVLKILDDNLSLRGRSAAFTDSTPLLGSLPELDSMAVVAVLTAFEDTFGFVIDDDERVGAAFETVGSLVDFVEEKLGAK